MPESGPLLHPLFGCAEPVSSLSHLLGAVGFVVLALLLVHRGRGQRSRVLLLGIYAAATVLVLALSGAYHLLPLESHARMVLLRLDHCAIFLFIAGTFTPIHGLLFRGAARWGMLLFIWAGCLAGLCLKVVYFADVPEALGLALYLFLGWCGLLAGVDLWRRYGAGFVFPFLAGGLTFTVSGVMEFYRWPTVVTGVVGPHEVFHAGVLAGVLLHWWFIYKFADGQLPESRISRERGRIPGSRERQAVCLPLPPIPATQEPCHIAERRKAG